jgi:hypothetical protein
VGQISGFALKYTGQGGRRSTGKNQKKMKIAVSSWPDKKIKIYLNKNING